MRFFRWCLAAAVLSLMLATPASAQPQEWGDPTNCFQAFYYPGHSVTLQTRVHFWQTGQDFWYQNQGWEYVDNGAVSYDHGAAANNYDASCEGDDYGDDGFFDYVWFHTPIVHTVKSDPYQFVGYRSAAYGSGLCNYGGMVEEGVFYEYPYGPWYELSWNGQYGPIASNWQAVQTWAGQASYNVYSVTCGSTAPTTYYTQYTWKTFIFGTFWNASTWFNWYDWTYQPEHTY